MEMMTRCTFASFLFLLFLCSLPALRSSTTGDRILIGNKGTTHKYQLSQHKGGKHDKKRNNEGYDDYGRFIVHLHPKLTHEEFELHAHDMYRRKMLLLEKVRPTNVSSMRNKSWTRLGGQPVITQRFTRLLHAVVIEGFTKKELMNIRGVTKVVQDSKKKLLRTHIGDKYTLNVGFTAPTWGQDRIDQATLPLDGQYNPLYDGSGTDIYVVDTGIDTLHDEFKSGDGFPNREVKNIWDAYAVTENEQNNPGMLLLPL